MEESGGIRCHLPRLGIDVSCNPYWRARSASISIGGYAVRRGRRSFVWMDAAEGNGFPDIGRVACGEHRRRAFFRSGLRPGLLGGATSSIRADGRNDGDDSGFYGAVRDSGDEDAAYDWAVGTIVDRRNSWGGSTGKSWSGIRRCAHRPMGRSGFDYRL